MVKAVNDIGNYNMQIPSGNTASAVYNAITNVCLCASGLVYREKFPLKYVGLSV